MIPTSRRLLTDNLAPRRPFTKVALSRRGLLNRLLPALPHAGTFEPSPQPSVNGGRLVWRHEGTVRDGRRRSPRGHHGNHQAAHHIVRAAPGLYGRRSPAAHGAVPAAPGAAVPRWTAPGHRRLSGFAAPAEPYAWPRSHILSGNPVQTATYIYTSPDNLFAAGIWTCEIGKFRIDFGRAEFIQILAGVVIVTDAEGVSKTYRAGDAFVTPKGFSGTWDVIEPIKKHFTWYGSGSERADGSVCILRPSYHAHCQLAGSFRGRGSGARDGSLFHLACIFVQPTTSS